VGLAAARSTVAGVVFVGVAGAGVAVVAVVAVVAEVGVVFAGAAVVGVAVTLKRLRSTSVYQQLVSFLFPL
jgi:hypothetical protein